MGEFLFYLSAGLFFVMTITLVARSFASMNFMRQMAEALVVVGDAVEDATIPRDRLKELVAERRFIIEKAKKALLRWGRH